MTSNLKTGQWFYIVAINYYPYYLITNILNQSAGLCKECLLKQDIGKDLYNKLTPEERRMIIETEGSVDFGHKVDFEKIKKILASDELID